MNKYDVKKITKRKYMNMFNELWNGSDYRIVTGTNGEFFIFFIDEHLLYVEDNNKYYRILNGPVDMEWFEEMYYE